MAQSIEELEKSIRYCFVNRKLLERALTHRSYAHSISNNERLEFLGDTVLQLIITDLLVQHYPNLSEGELTKFRSVLVCEEGLTRIANQLHLGNYIRISKGEEKNGGRTKSSILSDALEALFAAIYLDSKTHNGILKVEEVATFLFLSELEANENTFNTQDYKSTLQEWIQQKKFGTLEYQVLSESGPDHDKRFSVAVLLNRKCLGNGNGKTKKSAEQMAAYEALEEIKKNEIHHEDS